MLGSLGAVACSAAQAPTSKDIPAQLSAAGVTRVDVGSDGSDRFIDAHGTQLGAATALARDGKNAVTLQWQGSTTTMRWSTNELSFECGGVTSTYDASTGALSAALTDECRTLADVTDGVAALHQMSSPIKSVLARGQAQVRIESSDAMLMECGGTYYTSWGFTASSACNAAHGDCFTGGVDFCVQTSQDCGPVYCSCTYFNPCANEAY